MGLLVELGAVDVVVHVGGQVGVPDVDELLDELELLEAELELELLDVDVLVLVLVLVFDWARPASAVQAERTIANINATETSRCPCFFGGSRPDMVSLLRRRIDDPEGTR